MIKVANPPQLGLTLKQDILTALVNTVKGPKIKFSFHHF